MDSLINGVDDFVEAVSHLSPDGWIFSYMFNVYALFGIVLVCLVCGSMGALVVGNRMAFFSDALAHCAFAGFALGMVIFLFTNLGESLFEHWLTPIMVGFGLVVGLLIAFVREQTGLASDTVIGVFFAGAIGLGAIFTKVASQRRFVNIEQFIFGEPAALRATDLVYLMALLLITAVFLVFLYNDLILTSVSPSLAMSRNVPVRLCRYLFIMLLGLVVNLCLQVVGALLINALLIVPAATAANFCRNLRQLFWCSILISLATGVGGLFLSWEANRGLGLPLGIGGTIVVLNVLGFVISILFGSMGRLRGAVARA
jgi:zinc transport system permease protein